MTDRVERYLAQAKHCKKMSAKAPTKMLERDWLMLAEVWRSLACRDAGDAGEVLPGAADAPMVDRDAAATR